MKLGYTIHNLVSMKNPEKSKEPGQVCAFSDAEFDELSKLGAIRAANEAETAIWNALNPPVVAAASTPAPAKQPAKAEAAKAPAKAAAKAPAKAEAKEPTPPDAEVANGGGALSVDPDEVAQGDGADDTIV